MALKPSSIIAQVAGSTTTERVESVELAITEAAPGCASGQGYYFAKPLEASAALEYLKGRVGTAR